MKDTFPITCTDDGEINISCTHNDRFEITGFYINQTRVTGAAAVLLADLYDNEDLERDIKEAIQADNDIIDFYQSHRPDYPRAI